MCQFQANFQEWLHTDGLLQFRKEKLGYISLFVSPPSPAPKNKTCAIYGLALSIRYSLYLVLIQLELKRRSGDKVASPQLRTAAQNTSKVGRGYKVARVP